MGLFGRNRRVEGDRGAQVNYRVQLQEAQSFISQALEYDKNGRLGQAFTAADIREALQRQGTTKFHELIIGSRTSGEAEAIRAHLREHPDGQLALLLKEVARARVEDEKLETPEQIEALYGLSPAR